MKTNPVSIFTSFLFAVLPFCSIAFSQGPGTGGPPVAVRCAQKIFKSCKTLYGPFPSPNGDCENIVCFSQDYCTNGEPAVIYNARGYKQSEWDEPWNEVLFTPPGGGPGRLYETRSDSVQICMYESVCEYECDYVAGEGGKCIMRSRVSIGPASLIDHGPCIIPPDGEQ